MERSAFSAYRTFYNKATPSVASEQGKLCQPLLRSGQSFDACSSFSHKSFASQNLCGSPITPSVTTPKRASDAVTASRAVETALGQEMARPMCHFQVRKRSKPHRGFAKKALSHPSTSPQKILRLFFGTPRKEPRELAFALLPKSLSRAGFPCAGSLNLRHTWRLKLAERFFRSKKIFAKNKIPRGGFPSAASRAVEPALGQEMPRAMGHF